MWLFMWDGADQEQAEPGLDGHVVLDRDREPVVVQRVERAHDHRHGLVEPRQELIDGG